jgi:(2R)-3-sulfolactate dehydrogenase (NADP+)
MVHLTEKQALALATDSLVKAGTSVAMAASTAAALVRAEMQGIDSHGLSRIPQYVSHLRTGRVDGLAEPKIRAGGRGSVVVDACDGLAYPACGLAVSEAVTRARECGVAFAGVTRSHHCGVLVNHLTPLQAEGMVGIAFANSPAVMAAAGGRRPVFGTNPIAALFPRRSGAPLEIDLALSEVARGKLIVAARQDESIPVGWAVDADGKATTDPKRGLHGSMLAFGSTTSPKGALLALMVELLVTTLTGASFSFEASDFVVPEGNRPRIGQAFVVIDPQTVAGRDSCLDRIEVFIEQMLRDEGVRLPGGRRNRVFLEAQRHGFDIPAELHRTLLALAHDGH